MAEVEVTIDASRGAVTIRGEQAFVAETLEKYKFVFEQAPKAPAPTGPVQSPPQVQQPADASNGSLDSLSSVFDTNGDDVAILVTPPGNTIAAQTRSLTLLYLYARLKMGEAVVSAEAVKQQCKAHACFDPKNFSTLMKSQKSLITVTGSKTAMALKLTVPGRKAAEELAASLQNGS
jgi:hypothetical protein